VAFTRAVVAPGKPTLMVLVVPALNAVGMQTMVRRITAPAGTALLRITAEPGLLKFRVPRMKWV
jgi:hypothetical protein